MNWKHLLEMLRRCAGDERGQALTEYALVTLLATLPCLFLVEPDNGIYGALRELYDYISITMFLPGP